MIILIITFLSVLFSLISVWLIRKVAARHHIGSLPSPRKMHKKFVPLLGGGGVTAGMIAALIISQFAGILPFSIWADYIFFWLGLLVILCVGVWDDIKGIQSRIKFMGQGIAALLLILGGCKIQSFGGPMGEGFSLGAFAVPFTFLWIIFIINAVNLMDGLDGLAGGIGLIVITGFVIISGGFENRFLYNLGLGLAGGLVGFLRYKDHPASIFMGDTGSLQLGYIFAFFSIESLKIASSHQVYFLTSLTLLALPITDTLVAFLRRLSLGQSPFLADKQHIHHRLMKLGLSHLQTVWVLYLLAAFYVTLGVFMVYFQGIVGIILFAIGFVFAIFWVWRLGYVETRFSYQNTEYQFRNLIAVQRRAPIHFHQVWHKLILLLSDFITVNLALYLTYWIKFQSGILGPTVYR
ncbi:MAG: MraY family glycosyltransferase, partial [Calditrichia bacterium]